MRASEGACPFCEHEVVATPEPRGPAERLSRQALVAFGVGTLAVATACSSSSSPAIIVPYGASVFGDGFTVGSACEGKEYDPGTTGYLICEDGGWAYTENDPADAGYTLVHSPDGGDDAGDDASERDGGMGDAGSDSGS